MLDEEGPVTEPEILDLPPEEMGAGRPERRRVRDLTIEDPDGEGWHLEASRRWRAAERQSPEEPFAAYDPVPLPDFNAGRSASVSRDLLGRFLQDRDTGIVHDLYAAVPGCGADDIHNGTFFHFWSEVQADLAEDVPCSLCIP
jgi:hypothetical protein